MNREHYVIGAGLSGLIWAFYHPNYKIISSDVGGRFKEIAGPRFIKKTEWTERLLTDLNLPRNKKEVKVGYMDGHVLRSECTPSMKAIYLRKTGRFHLDSQSYMSDGESVFDAWDIDPNRFVEALRAEVGMDRILYGKVNALDSQKRLIHLSNNGKLYYNNLVSTIPFNMFWFFYYPTIQVEIHAGLPTIFVKAIPTGLYSRRRVREFSQYDYIYDCCEASWFHRVNILDKSTGLSSFETHKNDYEGLGGLNFFGIEYKITDIKRMENCQITTNPPKYPKLNNIMFLGRFAEWNHKIRTSEVIEKSIKYNANLETSK